MKRNIDGVEYPGASKREKILAPTSEDKSTRTNDEASSPKLRRRIKTLNQKLQGKNSKIESLTQLISQLLKTIFQELQTLYLNQN